jgi:hypothetical protein
MNNVIPAADQPTHWGTPYYMTLLPHLTLPVPTRRTTERVHRKRSCPYLVLSERVVVKTGKYKGQLGTIKRSGHGFYCIAMPAGEDVMKRGTELQQLECRGQGGHEPTGGCETVVAPITTPLPHTTKKVTDAIDLEAAHILMGLKGSARRRGIKVLYQRPRLHVEADGAS